MIGEVGDVPAGLRSLLDDFCGGFNVAPTLYSADGTPLVSSPKRYALPFCRKVGGWIYGRGPCAAQSKRMRHLVALVPIEQKLEAAESLMTGGTAPSIGEVAESIGYSDQFYFSRIYKKSEASRRRNSPSKGDS